jgi:hypothetical protein
MDRQALQRRAEVAMWGCLACAQPWLVAGSKWGAVWGLAAGAAWLVARMAGSGSQSRQAGIEPDKPWPRR